jgi:hypothetical protein
MKKFFMYFKVFIRFTFLATKTSLAGDQSQGDGVLQPKVARECYLGERVLIFPNPNGVASPPQRNDAIPLGVNIE